MPAKKEMQPAFFMGAFFSTCLPKREKNAEAQKNLMIYIISVAT